MIKQREIWLTNTTEIRAAQEHVTLETTQRLEESSHTKKYTQLGTAKHVIFKHEMNCS